MSREESIQRIFQEHHDAYLVDILGPANCGLSDERVRELKEKGLLSAKPLRDAVADSIHLGRLVEQANSRRDNATLLRLRHATLEQARGYIDHTKHLERTKDDAHPGHSVEGAVPLHMVHGHLSMKEPEPPEEHVEAARETPKWVTGPFRAMYGMKLRRLAKYSKSIAKAWATKFVELLAPASPEPEMHKVAKEAVRTGKDAAALAKELEGIYSGAMRRNWRRIAQTELQAALTNATLEQAIARYGEGARVARVPESSACDTCKALFLGADGAPLVFPVAQLLRNGTNVGVPKGQWRPTAYPVHPNCMCATQTVPPGMRLDARGLLVYSA